MENGDMETGLNLQTAMTSPSSALLEFGNEVVVSMAEFYWVEILPALLTGCILL